VWRWRAGHYRRPCIGTADAQIEAARDAIKAGDGVRALSMLSTAGETLDALRDRDLVSDKRADDVRAALRKTQAAVYEWTATSTTTVPPTAAPPSDDGNSGDDGGGSGNGKGRGKKKDD
jgi:hypothetical protein